MTPQKEMEILQNIKAQIARSEKAILRPKIIQSIVDKEYKVLTFADHLDFLDE
jgi:hypothetical protein